MTRETQDFIDYMNHRNRSRSSSGEKGSTTVEAVMALIILAFILFSMLQIYRWCTEVQTCQYASFYSTKALALGYKPNFILRAARVAGINISGASEGTAPDDEEAGTSYMIHGDASGVRYRYWHNHGSSNPYFEVSGLRNEDSVQSRVRLRNAQLLHANIFSGMVPLKKRPEPQGRTSSRNYGAVYLEE